MLTDIHQRLNAYYDKIPSNTLVTIAKSAVFSFSVNVMTGGISNSSLNTYSQPLMAAGIAALASLIHALMSPVFNSIFQNDHQTTFRQEWIKSLVSVGLTGFSLSYATNGKIDLLTQQVFSLISLNLLKSILHLPLYVLSPIEAKKGEDWLIKYGLSTSDGANNTYIVC